LESREYGRINNLAWKARESGEGCGGGKSEEKERERLRGRDTRRTSHIEWHKKRKNPINKLVGREGAADGSTYHQRDNKRMGLRNVEPRFCELK